MAKIFITGSSDGLGVIAARALVKQGHSVTLHARNSQRAQDALAQVPGAAGCLVGDLSSIAQTKALAHEANQLGRFDVVMHNAGLGYRESFHETEDGLSRVFAVNSLAPYILTCLIQRPRKLIYLSSGLHQGGDGTLTDITWTAKTPGARKRRWDPLQGYSDSKLQNVMLAFAVARKWAGTLDSNVCSPGWVKTKMGGVGAPGDAIQGARTQIKLAVEEGLGSGAYWTDMHKDRAHPTASDVGKQEQYLRLCEELSGVTFPRS